MELKIVRGVAPIVLIMYLAIRDFFFSSFSSSKVSLPIPQHDDHQHQSPSSSIFQILIYAKPSNLFVFFTFNVLLVAVLVGISSQLSKSSSSSYIELSFSSFIDSYEGLKRERDGDNRGYKDDFIPGIVYVHYDEEEKGQAVESYINDGTNFYSKNDIINIKEEVYGLPCVYGYVHHEHKDDFIPGIVHVEFKEESQKIHDDHDYDYKKDVDIVLVNGDDHGETDEIVMCGEYAYDDDEDMVIIDEEDGYSELDDIDFNKRIEEFIDENNKKRREELQNDLLLELN